MCQGPKMIMEELPEDAACDNFARVKNLIKAANLFSDKMKILIKDTVDFIVM